MFSIPESFRAEDEQYLTLPILRKFIRDNGLGKGKDFQTKLDYFIAIENYANSDDTSLEIVHEWLDRVLKEGMKDVYFGDIEIPSEVNALLQTPSLLASLFQPTAKHVCNGQHGDTLELKTANLKNTDKGLILSLCYTRYIIQYSQKTGGFARIYPVFVDIYFDRQLIVARAKSKAGLYDCSKVSDFDITKAKSLTTKTIIHQTMKNVLERINTKYVDSRSAESKYKGKLYKILDKYTFTPEVIQKRLDDNKDYLMNLANGLLDQLSVPLGYLSDTEYDVMNMAEKYISVSYPDKSIFTHDRDAFPLKLKATDDEDSTVEQASGYEEPLQSKAIFFDNKKMLQKAKACDGVTFAFFRADRKYYDETYKVVMKSDNGLFFVKFFEFTEEEDILRVLFEIIDA